MSMELTDSHTHTFYSGHGSGTVDEVVRAALERHITTLAITEHLPLPPAIDVDGTLGMTHEQMDAYFEDVEAARHTYRNAGIEIITGLEVDWRHGAERYLLDLLDGRPYELLLGSVHMLTDGGSSHWEFDHPDFIEGWDERGEEAVWQHYLELWTEALASDVPFDMTPHPDVPKKLNYKPTFDTTEYYHTMAEAAARAGVMIEVNTSGLYRPVRELYPAPALLKAFCEAGVPCTMSSDAHSPSHVGRSFEAGYAALRAAGYRHVTVPTRSGDRRLVPLNASR